MDGNELLAYDAAMTQQFSLQYLNDCDPEAFSNALAEIWEHAPWVPARVVEQRPFASTEALHRAMVAVVGALQEHERVALYAGHPELAGEDARKGVMTAASLQEQGTLGLERIGGQEADHWDMLNRAYRERFGFPFILCIRRHTRESALIAFRQRLALDRESELANALAEIAAITRMRLDRLVTE